MAGTKAAVSLGGIVTLAVRMVRARRPAGIDPKTLCGCGSVCRRPFLCSNPACGKSYPSHHTIPLRALVDGQGAVLATATREEVEEARAGRTYEAMTVEAVVPLKWLLMHYGLGEPEDLEPAPGPMEHAYAILAAALNEGGGEGGSWAALTRFTKITRTYRYALVSDGGLISAQEVFDTRRSGYRAAAVAPPEVQAAKTFLAGLLRPEYAFDADPDPVAALFEAKLRAAGKTFHAPIPTLDPVEA